MTYEEAVQKIPKGTYEHFKGGLYEVRNIAQNAETQKAMVVYFNVHKEQCWVRDADSWCEEVIVKRFRKVGD